MNDIALGVARNSEAGDSARGRETRSRHGAILWLTLAFWLSNFIILTAGHYLSGSPFFWERATIRGGLVLFGLLLCYCIHRTLQALRRRPFRTRAIVAAILAPIVAEIFAWASFFGIVMVEPARWAEPIRWSAAIMDVAFWTWFYLAWAGLYLALNYSIDVKEEEIRSSELRTLANVAKLRALHNQINPHFLFNSLNSISALILERNSDAAEQMVARLAGFLRRTLSIDPHEDIALSAEIELQREYLEIEQLRFPDLELSFDCTPTAARAAVPALILQPIVENAVKYGVSCSAPPARIEISAEDKAPFLIIRVADHGWSAPPGAVAAGTGVGLRNVRERLQNRFGEEQSVHTRRTLPAGFEVTLKMPLVPAS